MNLLTKIIFFTSLLTTNILAAQSVTMQDMGNGKYQFNSTYPDTYMHFYLLGDGYHSFESSPSHEYHSQNVPTTVEYFKAKPYDDEDIDPIAPPPNNPTIGRSNPAITKQAFKNKVEVKKSWNLMPNKETYLILMFENNDAEILSGCIELHFDPAALSITESEILDQYNSWVSNRTLTDSEYKSEGFDKKYKWEFDGLEHGEQRFIYVPVNSLGALMDEVSVRGVIKPDSECEGEAPFPYDANNDGNLDHITDSNYFTLLEQLRKNPHDPNCIVTDPYALSTYNENETVYYTIWFHNEGEAPAQDVTLDFFIDAPVNSMSYVASSDYCVVNFDHPATLPASQGAEILFPSIYLPGMGQSPAPNYYSTIGFLTLEVCFALPFFPYNFADSEVDIYFDSLPPVPAKNKIYRLTNNSNIENCVNPPFLLKSKPDEKELDLAAFVISPNPTDGICRVLLGGNFEGEVAVYNSVGHLLLKDQISGPVARIDLSIFPDGLFTIVLKDDRDNKVAKRVLKYE